MKVSVETQSRFGRPDRLIVSLAAALLVGVLVGGLLASLLAGFAAAGHRPIVPQSQPSLPSDAHRYIVQLVDPPLATYRGGIGKLAPTAASATGRVHLDFRGPAARAYRAYLEGRQRELIRLLRLRAPAMRLDWQYAYTLNGFSAKMGEAEAAWLRARPEVRAVEVAEYFSPDLDSSAAVVGAPAAWAAVGGMAEAGRGARVAIVDTGMDAGHPMFADQGMPAPPGGFPMARMHLRGGRVLAYPEEGRFVNGKLIAARTFPSPEMTEGLTEAEALVRFLPFEGGHGLHVAGIATGRSVTAAIPLIWQQTQAVSLTGMAPMAWVFNYRYDFSGGNEYGRGVNLSASPELIAMLDQMIEDEVDVLNLSEGHVTFLIDHPRTHPLAQAFEAASDAGVVVVASAGNSGSNGAPSLSGAFKYSDKVLAVGNTTSNGTTIIPLVVQSPGREPLTLPAGPRGTIAITETLEGPIHLAADGGCAVDAGANGHLALASMDVGACSYEARATMMLSSGARAILYLYNDRDYGGPNTQAIALRGVALGRGDRGALAQVLAGGSDEVVGRITPPVRRSYIGAPDVLAGSSARGPGIDGTLKPDLSAPGTSIWSSTTGGTVLAPVPGFSSFSGTSMSAPHVAGAVAVLRGAHPNWTSAQVHSALLNTSSPSVTVSTAGQSRPAAPIEGGLGRLDLTRAVHPGAFLAPTKVSFGRLKPGGPPGQVVVQLSGEGGGAQTWQVQTDALTGTGRVRVEPSSLTVGIGESKPITFTMDTAELGAGPQWGEVRFAGSGGGRLRTMYYAEVDDPAQRKDVLLVNFTMGATPDYGPVYTETLSALNLTYDVHAMDETAAGRHPTFEALRRHDLVILNTNESPRALQSYGGFYAYQNYLIQGGNLLVAGLGPQDSFTITSPTGGTLYPSQNDGCDMCLARYFAGFQFGLTSTLKGRVETWQDMKVLLEPQPDAGPPFDYPLDISTGTLAPAGGAGNQASFASGGLLGPFDPLVDHPYTEGVFDRVRPWARPLWSYDGRVVGSYVAGRVHPESRIRWNAMFWGFGLEGTGQGPATQARSRLLGDVFNLLAHDLQPRLQVVRAAIAGTEIGVSVPPTADPIAVSQALVDWGDGHNGLVLLGGRALDQVRLEHAYDRAGRYVIAVELYPISHAAPVRVRGEVVVDRLGVRVALPYASR